MPLRTVNTKYYTINQSSPGGYFIDNQQVGWFVIIEAINCELASYFARIKLDITFYNFGNEKSDGRWRPIDESDGHEMPTIYGQMIYDYADKNLPHLGVKSIHVYHFFDEHVIYKKESSKAKLEVIKINPVWEK